MDTEPYYISEKFWDKIEVGKSYYFEINSIILKQNKYNVSVLDVHELLAQGLAKNKWLTVKSVREPREDELGLAETLFIEYIE